SPRTHRPSTIRAWPTACTTTAWPRSINTEPKGPLQASTPPSATSHHPALRPAWPRRRWLTMCSSPGAPTPSPTSRVTSCSATAPASGYRDLGLAPGSSSYTVLAVDTAGNESTASAPTLATVTVPAVPPAAPVITFPTNAHTPITIDALATDVRGFAAPGST